MNFSVWAPLAKKSVELVCADQRFAMSADTAWRMYVRALTRPEVVTRSICEGDPRLTGPMLSAFALIS